MVVVLMLAWWVFVFLAMTGRTYRWLRGRGLGRHPAMVFESLFFAGLFTALWESFDPGHLPAQQLLLLFTFAFLMAYGSGLLRIRWLHLP